MKIKGIQSSGPNRGDPIEYKGEEKVPLAVGDAAKLHKDWEDFVVWPTGVRVGRFSSEAIGRPLKGKWQNNRYSAQGSGTFNFVRKASDKLLRPKNYDFTIRFEDCLDDLGQPDVKVTEFTVKEVGR